MRAKDNMRVGVRAGGQLLTHVGCAQLLLTYCVLSCYSRSLCCCHLLQGQTTSTPCRVESTPSCANTAQRRKRDSMHTCKARARTHTHMREHTHTHTHTHTHAHTHEPAARSSSVICTHSPSASFGTRNPSIRRPSPAHSCPRTHESWARQYASTNAPTHQRRHTRRGCVEEAIRHDIEAPNCWQLTLPAASLAYTQPLLQWGR